MNVLRRLSLLLAIASVLLSGIVSYKVLAQSQKLYKWMEEEAKLPPDVHPDTLSRMPRPKESDFATDDEKKRFYRIMHRNVTQDKMRWLGPTGTRVLIPQMVNGGDVDRPPAPDASDRVPEGDPVNLKYHELAVSAMARALDDPSEFIGHEGAAIKLYGMDLEMAIINQQDTKGMEPKAAALINYARDLWKWPRTQPLSSKALADVEAAFGKQGALEIASVAMSYDTNFTLERAYDQHMDTYDDCLPGGHHGCLDLKNPPLAWDIPTTAKPMKDERYSEWLAYQAKLPPEVHPDTLSRMARPTEADFNDKDKETFNRIMHGNEAQTKMRWLGPTGTRVLLPNLALSAEREDQAIHMYSGVDDKYLELSVAVAAREVGDRGGFINHEDDAIKAYGKELEDVVRLHKSTAGIDPKAAAIIEFARDLFAAPRTMSTSSKHFADLEANFGRKGALAIICTMISTDADFTLMRIYDQHMDINPDCLPGGEHGCLDLKNPPPAW